MKHNVGLSHYTDTRILSIEVSEYALYFSILLEDKSTIPKPTYILLESGKKSLSLGVIKRGNVINIEALSREITQLISH